MRWAEQAKLLRLYYDKKIYYAVMVVPEGKTVTVKDVANAAGEVVKDESSSFFAKLKAIFENLFASLKKIFSFGKK